MNKTKRAIADICLIAFCCCLIWIWVSSIVFSIRHPWATETETMLYAKEALLFEKVPYKEMRPRE